MRALIRLLLFVTVPIIGIAQKPPVKFGDVSIDDLKMNRYDKDSSASAVVLADYGESILQYDQNKGFVLHFERITRIKILTKDGLDQGNFSIPLYHDSGNDEKISGLKAVTYNLENGKIVESKLKNDGIFKEKYDANLDFTKVTLPNVKEGSVVEITYNVLSDFWFNFQDWEFQSKVPIRWSEYRARIPEYFNYDKYMQGYIPLDINENTSNPSSITITSKERGDGRVAQTQFYSDKIDFIENRFRWAAKDVPAFKPEPYITSARDYSSKINFELASTQFPNQPVKKYMGSWEDINRQFSESPEFGDQVSGNSFLKRTVEEITAGIVEPEEKIRAISNYVKQNITWDETSRKYTSKPLKKVAEDKKGNSAEINLLLASMLDKAGVSVYPVLLSTRDHGFIREETPISSQFNYVVCLSMVGEKSFLLDATERLLPTEVLPERCLNGKGFVVSKSGYKWIPLQSTIKSKVVVNADLEITKEMGLSGKLQIDRGGYDGLAGRKRYFSNDETEYVKNFVGSRPWEISKTEITNTKEIQQPMKEAYELIMSDQMTSAGNQIYLNPLLIYRIEENPFKLKNREYPVDFSSPFDRVYMCRIKIPEEYRVDELPKPKVMALPSNAGKYTYSVTQSGNILSVVSSLQINRSIFDQAEYPNLREFYNMVVAKQSEQIVLMKK
jgi:transglutaminase-like putative cysteine protease